jgi:hypothetical protein
VGFHRTNGTNGTNEPRPHRMQPPSSTMQLVQVTPSEGCLQRHDSILVLTLCPNLPD